MNDFEWVVDIKEPIMLPKNFKYYIVTTGYIVESFRPKIIELFGTDFTDNKCVLNWFNNENIVNTESLCGGVILGFSGRRSDLSCGWDDLTSIQHYHDYEKLEVEDFLRLINPKKII